MCHNQRERKRAWMHLSKYTHSHTYMYTHTHTHTHPHIHTYIYINITYMHILIIMHKCTDKMAAEEGVVFSLCCFFALLGHTPVVNTAPTRRSFNSRCTHLSGSSRVPAELKTLKTHLCFDDLRSIRHF